MTSLSVVSPTTKPPDRRTRASVRMLLKPAIAFVGCISTFVCGALTISAVNHYPEFTLAFAQATLVSGVIGALGMSTRRVEEPAVATTQRPPDVARVRMVADRAA